MNDYISRADAVRALRERYANDQSAIGAIYTIPAADVVPRDWHDRCMEIEIQNRIAADVRPVVRGEWIEENRRPRSSQFCCSVCHRTAYDPQPTRIKDWTKRCRYAFCPNCGADMRPREVSE